MTENLAFSSFTKEQWDFEIRNLLGIGVSDNDAYPLTTYHPINKEQHEIINNYFMLYQNKLSSFDELFSKLEKINNSVMTPETRKYTFNEWFPSYPYFKQAVSNISSFIDLNDTEVYPGITYHPALDSQLDLIKSTYDSLSQLDKLYTSNDITSFASNVVLLCDTPLDQLYNISSDGNQLTIS